MSSLRLTQLSPEQALERGLADRVEISTRPRPTPRQVLAVWLENFGVGVGGTLASGVVLYAVKVPDTVLATGALLSGATVFAAMMIWRGAQDEYSDWRNTRQVRRAWKALAHDYDARVAHAQAQLGRALDALDEADEEIAQLRKALDEMARQRDRAVYDLTREREQAGSRSGRSSYVAPVELAPQDVRDATAMIRYRYDTGEHLSRRKATDKTRGVKAWTEPQWDAAKAHLDAAGVIRIVRGQTEYPQTLDEALSMFGEYMLHTLQLSVPTVNKAAGRELYVESDEG